MRKSMRADLNNTGWTDKLVKVIILYYALSRAKAITIYGLPGLRGTALSHSIAGLHFHVKTNAQERRFKTQSLPFAPIVVK